jgi:hypothetical protein
MSIVAPLGTLPTLVYKNAKCKLQWQNRKWNSNCTKDMSTVLEDGNQPEIINWINKNKEAEMFRGKR